MPAPTTLAEFLDLVRRSGVVDEARLNAYVERAAAESPLPEDDPAKAAGAMVRDGILTHFQAEQFLLGKWRRFTIGKYKVLERLGSGGMGSVYLCEHIFMRRRVAVKVLPTSRSEDASAIERFYREARAVAALDHPNIVRAYDIDQDEGLHFLVMEHIDGSSLQEIVKRHGPLSIERAAHYMKQTALGLQHANQAAGLIHRDIKPGNILVDRKGVVKILDLGLARFFHDEEAPITQKFDENVLGTADYLAPEQALDSHNVDVRADIYSLGATFYFCLTGSTPFEGTVAQKLIWHQTRQPRQVRSLRPDVPEEMGAVVEKMMAKDPAQRYANPAEVMEALGPWTQNEIPPPPEHEMPRLSPAAMGTPGDGSQDGPFTPPSSVPAPSSRRWTGKPLSTSGSAVQAAGPVNAPSSVHGRMPAAAAAPASSPTGSGRRPQPAAARQADGTSLSWSGGAAETVNAAAKADTASQSKPRPAPARATPAPAARPLPAFRKVPPLVWLVGGSAAATLVLALIILKLVSSPEAPETVGTRPADRGRRDWFVTHVSQPGAYKTVREALYDTKPNDRVLVKDDIEESLVLEGGRFGRDVTIEPAVPGQRIVWRCPPNPKRGQFIKVSGIEKLKLKGFVFDGQGRVQELITLAGKCSGLVIEDCELRGAQRFAVGIWNCTAAGGTPVTLTRLHMATSSEAEAAVVFNSSPTEASALSKNIVVSDCRFEGPFRRAVSLAGPVDQVAFRGNRFLGAQEVFSYQKALPPNQLQVTVDSNTFADVRKACFRLEALPLTQAASLLDVSNNLFYRCAALAQTDDAARLAQADVCVRAAANIRDPASNEGNLPLHAEVMEFSLPTDPSVGDKLLRYPKGSPLTRAGLRQKPVGAGSQ